MKILLTSLLLCAAIVASAQTLKGIIVDERQQRVAGAVVRLTNIKDTLATISDGQGAFKLTLKQVGTFTLQLNCIGFKKLAMADLIIAKDTDLRVLVLKSETQTLAGVTITAAVPVVERQLDKTVVNVGQNITTEGATVLEVMRKLPGVQLSPDGQISMNGKPGVNVLIDGKSTQLSSDDLAALLGSMQASGIQRIELMTNPSSKYDAAGTAGIINIVKKKNSKEGINGSLNAGVGQGYYGKYNGGFTFSYKNNSINLLVNNAYTYNKKFTATNVASDISGGNDKLLTEQLSVNNSYSSNRNYRPTIGLDIFLTKRTTLTLSGAAGFGSAGSGLNSGMTVLDSLLNRSGGVGFESSLKDNPFNYNIGMQLTQQLDTIGQSVTIYADHSTYRNFPLQTNNSRVSDVNGIFISQTDNLLIQHRQLDIYAAKADYVLPLKNKGNFEAGLKTSYVKADNNNAFYNVNGGQNLVDLSQSDYAVNSENINAAYMNLNKSWSNISAEAGLRAEQTITRGKQQLTGESVDLRYLQVFPTLFLSDKINEQNALTLRLGRRTERPDYHELVPFRRPATATLFFQGNPNLKPQVSWHGELSWNFQQALTLTFNYDIYNDYIRTFPYLDSNKTTITRRPTNIQNAHGWEIDLAYAKALLPWWSTDNTLVAYRNAFSGQASGYSLANAGIVSFQLNANNSFRISPTLSAECDFEYDGKRQFVNSTFGAYSVLNLALKRSLFAGKGSVTLNGNNILQTEDHNAIDRNQGLYQYSYLHFYSRAIMLSFSYRFGNGKSSKIKMASGSAEEQKRAGS